MKENANEIVKIKQTLEKLPRKGEESIANEISHDIPEDAEIKVTFNAMTKKALKSKSSTPVNLKSKDNMEDKDIAELMRSTRR